MSDEPENPDDLTRTDDSPVFQDRGRWIWPVLAGLVVLIALGAFGGRPAYNLLKRQRALSMVREGNQRMEEGRWDEVAKIVQTTLRLAPNEPETLRLVARFCTRNGSPQGIPYWQTLLTTKSANQGDLQEFIRYLHDIGRLDLATPELKRLIGLDSKNVTNQLLMLDQWVLLKNWPAAVRGAELALKDHPDDPFIRYVAARALLGTGNPRAGLQAAALLREIKKPGQPLYLGALRTLASLKGLPSEEVRSLIQELEALPEKSLGDRILKVELQETLEPSRSAVFVDEFARNLPKEPTAFELTVLGGFLRSRGRHDLILAMAPPGVGATNGALAMIAIDALVDLRRWDEVLMRLTNSPAVDLVTRQCTLATYANETGRIEQAFELLKSAATFAVTNLNQLQIVANLAERLGETDLVLEIWTTALADPRSAIGAANNLLRIGASRDDYTAERRANKRLMEILGNEPAVVGEWAYLAALHEDQVQEAHDALNRMVSENPGAVSPRAALALAKLQLGDRTGALGIMEAGGVDWEKAEPRWRAVYAAVLDANQQRAAARRFAVGIPVRQLRAPERRLIEPIAEN